MLACCVLLLLCVENEELKAKKNMKMKRVQDMGLGGIYLNK